MFTYRAAWSGITAYAVNDLVTYDGTSYVCLIANTDVTPGTGDSWSVLAQKGDVGSTGPQGDAGATGSTGPQGDAGPAGATGPTGSTGPQGDVGPTGATGPAGSGVVSVTVPALSSFTWQNQNGAVATQATAGLILQSSSGNSGPNIEALTVAVPVGTSWTIYAKVGATIPTTTSIAGLMLTDGTKLIVFGPCNSTPGIWRYNTANSGNGNAWQAANSYTVLQGLIWLSISLNAGVYNFAWSQDGCCWAPIPHQETVGDFLTATAIGLFVDAETAAPCGLTCYSFSSNAPAVV